MRKDAMERKKRGEEMERIKVCGVPGAQQPLWGFPCRKRVRLVSRRSSSSLLSSRPAAVYCRSSGAPQRGSGAPSIAARARELGKSGPSTSTGDSVPQADMCISWLSVDLTSELECRPAHARLQALKVIVR